VPLHEEDNCDDGLKSKSAILNRSRHERRRGQLGCRGDAFQGGFPVVGLTMQLWNQRRLPELDRDGTHGQRCCSIDDVYDARRVAQHLGMPHYV